MKDRERDPAAAEAWENRDEPEEWADSTEDVQVQSPASHVVSFRLDVDEIEALTESARGFGESVSEYIRKSLAIRMHGTPIGPSVEIASGAGTLVVRSHIVTPRSTEPNDYDWIPDMPPATSSIT